MQRATTGTLGLLLLFGLSTAAGAAEAAFIAGLTPDRRPPGAPTISTVTKDGAWYRQALIGIDPPYPASLRFLEDEGNWFTPFIWPGMLGPYDLRGWHRQADQNSSAD